MCAPSCRLAISGSFVRPRSEDARRDTVVETWPGRRQPVSPTNPCSLAGAIGVGSPTAAAQVAKIKPAPGDDLRAAYANAADVAEGKRLAETACAACHGANGISSTKGVPHLAAQRPGYLYLELKAYQSGTRGDSAMGGAVKPLSDDALFKVAAYYASLDPAQPAALSGAKPASGKVDPVQAVGSYSCGFEQHCALL
jgi:cytochrome c553